MRETRKKREPLGRRLVASMSKGLAALEGEAPLPARFVPKPPDPPPFDKARVVRLRQRYGMSQSSLAIILKVSGKTVQSWEQGARKPTGSALRLLQILENPDVVHTMIPHA